MDHRLFLSAEYPIQTVVAPSEPEKSIEHIEEKGAKTSEVKEFELAKKRQKTEHGDIDFLKINILDMFDNYEKMRQELTEMKRQKTELKDGTCQTQKANENIGQAADAMKAVLKFTTH